jgi:hypothetical protein
VAQHNAFFTFSPNGRLPSFSVANFGSNPLQNRDSTANFWGADGIDVSSAAVVSATLSESGGVGGGGAASASSGTANRLLRVGGPAPRISSRAVVVCLDNFDRDGPALRRGTPTHSGTGTMPEQRGFAATTKSIALTSENHPGGLKENPP